MKLIDTFNSTEPFQTIMFHFYNIFARNNHLPVVSNVAPSLSGNDTFEAAKNDERSKENSGEEDNKKPAQIIVKSEFRYETISF